ncbi:methyltransferase domain-containing protein [Pyrenochaeta sp. MPI-SDFR-AT-0127]|nr:methyltransferase domain-containing protein [Pyrenochaeta sp. MPI-SDFR-AT-0127]
MTNTIPENLKARMKESYDAIAEEYNTKFTTATDHIRLEYLSRLFAQLQSTGNDTATVLELGCGAGVPATRFLLQSEKPLIHVTGNDLSTSQLDLARTNLAPYAERLTLVEGDMNSLSFPDNSFDAVTGFYSIIHLPREEQTQLVKKIAQWLKPGGHLLANFGAEENQTIENEKWLGHDKGWMFWSGWGEEKSVKMVEEAGFKVMERELRQAVGDAEFVWILARKYAV